MKLSYFVVLFLITSVSSAFELPATNVHGLLNMTNNVITGVAAPVNDSDAVNKSYVDNIDLSYLPLSGGVMSGQIDIGGIVLFNLSSPVNDSDAANKAYVQSVATGGGLPTTGGTMSGDINMGGRWVYNLSAPSNTSDAATKTYVDANDTLLDGAIVSANTSMKDYVDANDTLLADAIVSANASMKSYVDANDTLLDGAIVTANSSMKDYVDSKVGTTNAGDLYWDDLPIRFYNGTTLIGLINYIYAMGDGTYIPTQELQCAAAVTINGSMPEFKVMSPQKGWYGSAHAGRINITVTSGSAITIANTYTEFEDIVFYQPGTDDVHLLTYASNTDAGATKNVLDNCDIIQSGTGTSLWLGNNSGLLIKDSMVYGSLSGYACEFDSESRVYCYFNAQNTQFVNYDYLFVITEYAWISISNNCNLGYADDYVFLIAPGADYELADLFIQDSLIDQGTQNGQIMRFLTEYYSENIYIDNCRIIIPSSGGMPFDVTHVNNFRITGNTITVGSSFNNIFNFVKSCENVVIMGNDVEAVTGYAFNIDGRTGADANENFVIVGNMVQSTNHGIFLGNPVSNATVVGNVAIVEDTSAGVDEVAHNVYPVSS